LPRIQQKIAPIPAGAGGVSNVVYFYPMETNEKDMASDRLPEHLAEILEAVWTLEEKGEDGIDEVAREARTKVSEELLRSLEERNLVQLDGGRRIRLAKEGRLIAERIIRRHRLAERLICDALGADVDDSEDAACEFEHVLAVGITNSICTLLGHPRYCPHGRLIPEGECCRKAQEEVQPILVSGDQLHAGESAVIAYLCVREHARMLKLSSLGLTPGNRLKLLQKWPSYVFQCDETEIALEESVARDIYVRR
jgi:DtxR family transcriptional regulator, Mn-dependent transcriptional regulator